MKQLASLQADFIRGVFGHLEEEVRAILQCIDPGCSPNPEQRLGIYRSAIFGSLGRVMVEIYPVLARLLGETFFTAMARVYATQHPSLEPDLNAYGEHLPEFLEQFEPLKNMNFLSDVARLEWYWHEIFYAADTQPCNFAELAALDVASRGRATFSLPPAAHLLQTEYPVSQIWVQNQPEVDEPEEITLDSYGEYLLIWRAGYERRIEPLSRDQWRLLQAVNQGWDFTELLEKLAGDIEIDLMLPDCFRRGWIAGVNLADTADNP